MSTEEPRHDTWQELSVENFARELGRRAESQRANATGPTIIAVNGRSGAGKTTLARALGDALPNATVVAADDLMWWEPMWQWHDMAIEHLFEPLRKGEHVEFAPPQWKQRGRSGSISVPSKTEFVVFEGVGSSQVALKGYVDASVWVQSDRPTARRLGIRRDTISGVNGDPTEATQFWDAWETSEFPFLENDQPWQRADVTVLGVDRYMPTPGRVRVRWSTR